MSPWLRRALSVSAPWGLGTMFWGLGYSLPYPNPWFIVAYIVFCIAFAWSLIGWSQSDSLREKRPHKGENDLTFKAEQRIFRTWQFGVSGLIFLLFMGSLYTTYRLDESVELDQPFGRLYPANDPLPDQCSGAIDEGSLAMFLGNIVSITHTFPHTVLEVDKESIITLDRASDGSLLVSFVLRGPDNRVIVQFENGEFLVGKDVLKKHRSDRHSLEVTDAYGNTLKMKYFHPRAMWIDAMLPGMTKLRGSIRGPGAMCLVDNAVSIRISRARPPFLSGPRHDQLPPQP
ncbi:MAG: hypothetical protein ACOYXU_06655 [Nitrospirota bacterium]